MSGGGFPGRGRWLQAGVAVLLVAPGVFLLAARGGAATDLGNYNGTVSATAVHLQAGSSAFPNFATGAIDNRYPLATARLDSSPNAEAYSSPLDTGPAGQTGAGEAGQNQPQYADVRCPAQCDDKPVTVGSQPGPFASSQAADRKAVAIGQAGGVSSGGGAPALPAPPPPKSDGASGLPGSAADSASGGATSADAASPGPEPAGPASAAPAALSLPTLDAGRAAALRAALVAWRARYLTADDAGRYPMPAAGTPDGVAGDTARSEARLEGSTLVLEGTSSVGQVVLGGGALVLNDVSVHATVTNDGTPKKTVAVDVGAASVGGTPVTIGADGVSVNGQAVPGLGGAGAQASAALNQVLGQAGFEVRSLGPAQNATDHQLTLDAVGVLIRIAPASPAPGVPAQFMAMAVGEVFADSLAVPGEASGSLDDGLGGAGGLDSGAGSLTPADTATTGQADRSGLAAPAATEAAAGLPSDGEAVTGGASSGLSGSSGSSFGSGSTAGSGSTGSGTSSSIGRQLASPAVARRVLGHDKPTKLLLLYLLWQSLMIGTVASLYLWRKAAA